MGGGAEGRFCPAGSVDEQESSVGRSQGPGSVLVFVPSPRAAFASHRAKSLRIIPVLIFCDSLSPLCSVW